MHAVWHFANSRNAFWPNATQARAKRRAKAHKRAYRFKYQGHKRVAR